MLLSSATRSSAWTLLVGWIEVRRTFAKLGTILKLSWSKLCGFFCDLWGMIDGCFWSFVVFFGDVGILRLWHKKEIRICLL